MRKNLPWATITVILFFVGQYFYYAYLQDQCLEQNGVWDAQQHVCTL